MKFHEIFDFLPLGVLNLQGGWVWVGGVRCLELFPKKSRFFFTPSLILVVILEGCVCIIGLIDP